MVAANGKKKRKKEKSHLLLLYFTISENTPFLPGNYISLTFSWNGFEEKHLSPLPHCIFLPPKITIEGRVTSV